MRGTVFKPRRELGYGVCCHHQTHSHSGPDSALPTPSLQSILSNRCRFRIWLSQASRTFAPAQLVLLWRICDTENRCRAPYVTSNECLDWVVNALSSLGLGSFFHMTHAPPKFKDLSQWEPAVPLQGTRPLQHRSKMMLIYITTFQWKWL